MKICRNCKFESHGTCYHPCLGIDVVSGSQKSDYCIMRRSGLDQRCGPEGKQFEPRETIHSAIKRWLRL